MIQMAEEMSREYRLHFNNGETHWNDPIPPEVTSGVLGKRTTSVINRTSLLAWSLMMNLREVHVADVTADGWMKIQISTGPEFEEAAFTRDVAQTILEVSQVRSHVGQEHTAPSPREVQHRLGTWHPTHTAATHSVDRLSA